MTENLHVWERVEVLRTVPKVVSKRSKHDAVSQYEVIVNCRRRKQQT